MSLLILSNEILGEILQLIDCNDWICFQLTCTTLRKAFDAQKSIVVVFVAPLKLTYIVQIVLQISTSNRS